MTYNDSWWRVYEAHDQLNPDQVFYVVQNPHGWFYSQRFSPPTPSKHADEAERFFIVERAHQKALELNNARLHDAVVVKANPL